MTWIEVLPDTVEGLEQINRDLADAIYGADPQTPLPIDSVLMENLRCGTRCRKKSEHGQGVERAVVPTVAMIGNLIRTELRNAGNVPPIPIQYFRPEHQHQGQGEACGPYVGAGFPQPLGRPMIMPGGYHGLAVPPLQNLGQYRGVADTPLQHEGPHLKGASAPLANMLENEKEEKRLSIEKQLKMVEDAVETKKDPPEGHFV